MGDLYGIAKTTELYTQARYKAIGGGMYRVAVLLVGTEIEARMEMVGPQFAE